MRKLLAALLLLVLVGLGYVWWRQARLDALFASLDGPAFSGLNRRQRAVWMAHKWFGKAPSPEEVKAAAEPLARLGFQDLYFHVGPLDAHGQIPAWDPEAWRRTLTVFRQTMPGLRAFAWVGGVTVQGFGQAPDTVDDGNPEVRAAVVKTCQDLMERGGFDGIHYDLEPIPPGDQGFLALLTETRPALGEHPLSVAAPLAWDRPYVKEVAPRCDQVALMSYEMGCPTAEVYEDYMERLLTAMCDMLEDSRASLIIGVPSYAEVTSEHQPQIENAITALIGIKRGLLKASRHRAFQGIGLYAHWTADAQAWKAIGTYWKP